MATKNGNIVKWVAILIGLGLAVAGWIYQLGVQGEQLRTNTADDAKVHIEVPKLDIRMVRVEENVKEINRNFTEFQKQALENQREILRALAQP